MNTLEPRYSESWLEIQKAFGFSNMLKCEHYTSMEKYVKQNKCEYTQKRALIALRCKSKHRRLSEDFQNSI